MLPTTGFRIGVDIGGTFSDCSVIGADGRSITAKSLTTPGAFEDGVLEVLGMAADQLGMTVDELLSQTSEFVHGNTIGTNTVIERSGVTTALVTTRGHEDTLEIGRLFAKRAGLTGRAISHVVHLSKPEPLVPRELVFGVEERVDADGRVVVPFHEAHALEVAEKCRANNVRAVAISFLWSFRHPGHEQRMKEILERELPGCMVIATHEVFPVSGEYERTVGTMLNCYMGPRVVDYIERLADRLRDRGFDQPIRLVQSEGGNADLAAVREKPIITLDSGPVGGILGARAVGAALNEPNLICTDVGGTSFDVGLCWNSTPQMEANPVVGQLTYPHAKVSVSSVGAGGGSIAWVDDGGMLHVGPESAGSSPGPACYGLGNEQPTLTDACVVLGLQNPSAIAGGRLTIHPDLAFSAFESLGARLGMSVEEAAYAVHAVAIAQMSDLIRKVTIECGFDPRDFMLVAYGGAGSLNAAFYGADLGTRSAYIPGQSSVFSAYGMLSAAVTASEEFSWSSAWPVADHTDLVDRLRVAQESALSRLSNRDRVRVTTTVRIRYLKQSHSVDIDIAGLFDPHEHGSTLRQRFESVYSRIYGALAVVPDGPLELTGFRVAVSLPPPDIVHESSPEARLPSAPTSVRSCLFDLAQGPLEVPVFAVEGDLPVGWHVPGPCLIDRPGDTIVVPPEFVGEVDSLGGLLLKQG